MTAALARAWAEFHFMRPAWLLALPLLWVLAAWLARRQMRQGSWTGLVDAELLAALRLDGDIGARRASPWPWVALAWTLAVLALAGPSWARAPGAAWRAPAAWVLVLDLSPSMDVADVAPNRITRARYAIDDLLDAAEDARVGLVVFGAEAFTVTPLTDDVATVRALLAPLAPGILPSAGDRLAAALAEAGRLLERAAVSGGHVIVLSDGFDDPAAALTAAGRLHAQGATVDVVSVGTVAGAPEPDPKGGFVRDAQGRPRLARLDPGLLQHLAGAGGGREVGLAGLPGLIAALHEAPLRGATRAADERTTRWLDAGAWLLPALLLLCAGLARRGWL